MLPNLKRINRVTFHAPQKCKAKKWGLCGLGGVSLVALLMGWVGHYLQSYSQDRLFLEPSGIKQTRVAIVFGAGVYADGTPTPMLADRLESAVALYQQHKVKKLLLSGDNGSPDYDEVTNMKRYVVRRGVPASDVTLDYAGFSTYETCYRARAIFGVHEAVLVTQSFHLPRALYICAHLGVQSQGLGTPDAERYTRSALQYYRMREVMSGVKALWEVHVTRPQPTFLGAFEGIDRSSSPSP